MQIGSTIEVRVSGNFNEGQVSTTDTVDFFVLDLPSVNTNDLKNSGFVGAAKISP